MKSLLAWVAVLLLQGVLLTGAQDCPGVVFSELPQDMTATLGDTDIRLHCSVSDRGLFNWQHYLLNGTRWTIRDNTFQELRGFTIDNTNGDLLISVVQSFHAGLYSCFASRFNCYEESINATFIVNDFSGSSQLSGFPLPTNTLTEPSPTASSSVTGMTPSLSAASTSLPGSAILSASASPSGSAFPSPSASSPGTSPISSSTIWLVLFVPVAVVLL